MASEQRSVVFTLPPIGPWSKRLATAVGVLWIVHVVLYFVVRSSTVEALPTVQWLALSPQRVVERGQVWRLVTYAILDLPNSFDGLWSMLILWWFGTPIEQREGVRSIALSWVVATLGGAALLMVASRVSPYFHSSIAMGLLPVLSNALLVKWGFLFARQRVSFFGMAEMDGRILAGVLCGITVLNALVRLRAFDASAVVTLGSLGSVALWLWVQQRRGSSGSAGPRKRTGSGAFKVIKGGKSDEKKWVN